MLELAETLWIQAYSVVLLITLTGFARWSLISALILRLSSNGTNAMMILGEVRK